MASRPSAMRLRLVVVVAFATAAASGTPPTSQPSTRPTTQRLPLDERVRRLAHVPVVFAGGGEIHFTPARRELLLRVGLTSGPVGRDIWFVQVNSVDRWTVSAWVVYAPDVTSPRLRKGRCVMVSLGKVVADEERFKRSTRDEPHAKTAARRDTIFDQWDGRYVQVSRADAPFGDALRAPAPRDLPLPPPRFPPALTGRDPDAHVQPMDDADLVRLVDVARAKFDETDDQTPVTEIVGNAAGTFGVAQHAPGSGGNYVHVRQDDGGAYRVTREGSWVGADDIWWPYPERPEAGDPRF